MTAAPVSERERAGPLDLQWYLTPEEEAWFKSLPSGRPEPWMMQRVVGRLDRRGLPVFRVKAGSSKAAP